MIQIGDIRIHLINDCESLVDPGGMFGLVPRALWSRYSTPNDDQLITSVATCLFVEVGDQKIVIDTGYGTKIASDDMQKAHLYRPNGGLIEGLARLGVSPDDITLVIDTHLHSDHAGGNTKWNDDKSDVLPVFPNAEYVVQQREYEDAMRPNERTRATYYPFNYEPLVKSGQMRLLNGDTELASGVRGIITRGHTPAHMSIRFESNGEHGAFLCDMASRAVHFERIGWMTAYDVEPLYTLETKRQWQQWALETNAIIIFPHDPDRPLGRLTQNERGHTILDPIDEAYV